MSSHLIEKLKQVKDFRTSDGQRHSLWLVLLIVIMGTMSGYVGYRALGDFALASSSCLNQDFENPQKRLPSYSTIRRVMMGIDFREFVAMFNQWAYEEMESEKNDWLAIDGKSLKGTVTETYNEYQNFVSVVSVFSQQKGVVVSLAKLDNATSSEIQTVQTLIQVLQLEGVILSLDALHCQKTTQMIVESGNDYVIAVKANQKHFINSFNNSQSQKPRSCLKEQETTRGRVTTRTVSVFDACKNISADWVGLKTFVKVERFGTRAGQPYQHTAYYISSLCASAVTFAQGIRGHWLIENQLHWVKDVVFGEERSSISSPQAATNFSIVRSIVLNLFRKHGYSSLTQARRLVANDLYQILFLLE